MTLTRRAVAEFAGTAMLLAVVVGSGIMGERLAGGNAAIALLANAIATGCGLIAIILMFGAISGAHFNPAITLTEAWRLGTSRQVVSAYLLAQVAGAIAGVAAAHLMFELPLYELSTKSRGGAAQAFSEFIATFGLLVTIRSCQRSHRAAVPYAVAAYITAAYWFTASTSFANPVVTIARAMTNTFAGIHPGDVPAFIVAQLAGAAAATLLSDWLDAGSPRQA
jgi:glycerol uptake facilitator-like aquaporin